MLKINVQGGTGAGHKMAFNSGHAPMCQCKMCSLKRWEARNDNDACCHGGSECGMGIITCGPPDRPISDAKGK